MPYRRHRKPDIWGQLYDEYWWPFVFLLVVIVSILTFLFPSRHSPDFEDVTDWGQETEFQ